MQVKPLKCELRVSLYGASHPGVIQDQTATLKMSCEQRAWIGEFSRRDGSKIPVAVGLPVGFRCDCCGRDDPRPMFPVVIDGIPSLPSGCVDPLNVRQLNRPIGIDPESGAMIRATVELSE